LIITEGAFDMAGRFIKQEFVPARHFYAKCFAHNMIMRCQE